ncbi:HAD-IC family P-type ATPase [Alicyclobacillus dauci]|uniref:Cation-translocating P-type ATPase n=1 Tax=Alicyclobacillus dauci TaxID=1475485 RepID=A0ABY6Z2I9_9BACL|nr:HAD-IC family P-type ATPase [Alicyclobacillus dauci]WAH37118.1 cation-translocating P-type ATPase [Alicyclobacillus dauci]
MGEVVGMEVEVVHRLPGRIRVAIHLMKNRALLAYQLEHKVAHVDGVIRAQFNPDTGRALVQFDEDQVSEVELLAQMTSWVQQSAHREVHGDAVAATIESEVTKTQQSVATDKLSRDSSPRNPYLLPALASGTLLAGLAIKRLAMGRGVLTGSPLTFWAAAGLSVAAGYPALRRGLEGLMTNKRIRHPDIWVGLATMSTVAMRENLVALAVVTALNVAMYRRHKKVAAAEDTRLPSELDRYSARMSRASMVLTPLTLLLTRSPIRSIGVALGLNPRPAIASHTYRWAEAEREAQEKHLLIPTNCGLSALAEVKEIVLSHENLIFEDRPTWKVESFDNGLSGREIVRVAASLLQNCDHPWRDWFVEENERAEQTLDPVFDIECSLDGTYGHVNGVETQLGTPTFITTFGIDDTPVLETVERFEKDGFTARVLAQEGKILAVVGCKSVLRDAWADQIGTWNGLGYRVRILEPFCSDLGTIETVTRSDLTDELDSGKRIIFVGDEGMTHAGAICFGRDDFHRLPETLSFCRQRAAGTKRDLRIAKGWNWLGAGAAMLSPWMTPLVALTGDVVSMFLIASQRWGFRRAKLGNVNDDDVAAKLRGGGGAPHSGHMNHWHVQELSALFHQLRSAENGLSTNEALSRLKRWGANQLAAPKPPNTWRLFAGQFKELSTIILIATAALSFFMGEPFSAACMLVILIINAAIATWQEQKSLAVIQDLKVEKDATTCVVRDGVEQVVPVQELVPGDVVVLKPGDKVPADMRVIEAWNLQVIEAMLTGESVPVSKRACEMPEDTPLADRENLLYMGTAVTRGRCKALVVATGSSTQMGALEHLLLQQADAPTFLQSRVTQISKRFVIGAFMASAAVTIAGLLRGMPAGSLLISSITLAASAIPEGLPLTITVALTAGVRQMSKRRAVVKKLANLESLGRVTVICCDKTGTLTRNEMTVMEAATVGRRVRIEEGDVDPTEGYFREDGGSNDAVDVLNDADLRELMTIGMLCNNAHLDDAEHVTGDPTERALLTVASKANLSHETWKRHLEIPFDSATRSMSVVCEENEQANVVCEDKEPARNCRVFSKGAVETIVGKCTHYQLDGEVHPLTEEIVEQIRLESLRMADSALRVLAFAYRPVEEHETPSEATDTDLIYVGLMGMMDPPKDGVAQSIDEARHLGVRSVMITGDHPLTARAIGRQLGIFRPGDRILTGQEIDELSQAQFDQLIAQTTIFARVSPEHKLRIVEAYQRIGEVVAMTGDGVNDAPAIRRADVGIAMGLNGSDIAKGTAGVVLLEDHFHSIVDGVKGGRSIIGNIRKAMGCLLAGNLAEVLVTAVSIIIGLPVPLIPLQILLMNILTDAVPAMVLATGSQEDVAENPYKDVIDKNLYRTVVLRGCVLGLGAVAVFATGLSMGLSVPLAQTMTYASLVLGQLMQLPAWRTYGSAQRGILQKDKVLLVATCGSLLTLIATIYLPGLTHVFATVPLGLRHWAVVLAVTSGLAWFSQRWNTKFSGERVEMKPTRWIPLVAPSM